MTFGKYGKVTVDRDKFGVEALQNGEWVVLYQCRPLDAARNIAKSLARIYKVWTRVTFGDYRQCAGALFEPGTAEVRRAVTPVEPETVELAEAA